VAWFLHRGSIAEMRTGEGKTLAATLPAYLNALSGAGVHIVTVNDYLSRRDATWMGRFIIFSDCRSASLTTRSHFLYDPTRKDLDKGTRHTGLFQVVTEFLRPVSRPEAYAPDITYGTNNEFGFDICATTSSKDVLKLRQRDSTTPSLTKLIPF